MYNSVFNSSAFAGKVYIITGGGSGIGRCIAYELCSLGATVIITGRSADKLSQVCSELEDSAGYCVAMVCDSREEEQVKNTVQKIVADHGRIDGLVNNAGGQYPALLEGLQLKGFNAVMNNNLNGTFLMMREVYNQYLRDHGGVIVNMSIAMAESGLPGMAHSGCSRSAVESLSKSAAIEWARSGVRVNSVAPGWIVSSGLNSYKGTAVEMLMPGVDKKIPLQRKGTESEVSAAICFLLSDAASYITGVSLKIDGGTVLSHQFYPMPSHEKSQAYNGFNATLTE